MDRLSNLPDEIRSQILSFLPTKDALQTSLLSTKWKYTSSSLAKLEFRHYLLNSETHTRNFKKCVYKTLSLRNENFLESLFLDVFVDDKHITSNDLSNWITTALKQKLQSLQLKLPSPHPDAYSVRSLNLPTGLFQCNTLRYLNFENFILQLPSRIRFPNLKTLVLYNICFTGHDDDDGDDVVVNNLFKQSTFPVLEELELKYCPQISTLRISIPTLRFLKLLSYKKILRVVVSVPSLRNIFYIGCPLEVCSKTLASLHTGFFQFHPSLNPNTYASDILFRLRSIETLQLKSTFIESLSDDQSFFGKSPVLSATLKHLHLEIFRTKKQTRTIRFLSKCFPQLQNLHIYSRDTQEDKVAEEQYVLTSNSYLDDVSNFPSLRRIEFKYFEGSEAELDLVHCLLQRASNLTKVDIGYKADMKEPQMRIIEKLMTLPRVASHVT